MRVRAALFALRHAISIAIAALALAACTNKVIQIGPNAYSVGGYSAGQETGGATANAMQEARAFCAERGEELVVLETELGPVRGRTQSAIIEFRCD